LFPHNAAFFQSHAGMTLFPDLIAGSLRLTHVSPEIGLLGWQLLSIFLVLWGSFRIAALCFREKQAIWCGVGIVACLLTLPVAGTALYVMDQYLTPRSLSTPLALHAVAWALERQRLRALLCAGAIGAIHPLMGVFAVSWLALFVLLSDGAAIRNAIAGWFRSSGWVREQAPEAGILFPLAMFPAITPAYRKALLTHPYFLLNHWEWYEWLGIVGPFLILAGFERLARRQGGVPVTDAIRGGVLWRGPDYFGPGTLREVFGVAADAMSAPGLLRVFDSYRRTDW
jgi:hypothetical protein